MVCGDCMKKLDKIITPDVVKLEKQNTGRDIAQNTLLGRKRNM
jgi:hypothetical protein